MNIAPFDGFGRTVTLDVNPPPLGVVSVDLTGGISSSTTLSMPGGNDLYVAALAVGGYDGANLTNGRGAVNQSAGHTFIYPGGDLILGWGSGSRGTYTLSGGFLTANQAEFIGYGGTGTFHHSAGTNVIYSSALGSLTVGTLAGSTGTYNLSGTGTLVSYMQEYIGYFGSGTFNQTGGSHTIEGGGLTLGGDAGSTGTYNLSGRANWVSNADVFVGYGGSGTVHHSAGTHTINEGTNRSLAIGVAAGSTGTYNLSGTGTLVSNEIEYIGYHGNGNFVQTGGTNTIESGGLGVGSEPGSLGYYRLDAGTLTAVTAVVGVAGQGILEQRGGTININNRFFIGELEGAQGTYTLQGGTATVEFGHVSVGRLGTGVLNVGGTGTLNIPDNNLAIFNSVGSEVNLSGGTINAQNVMLFPGAEFNWTGGTLNITNNVTWDSAAVDEPTKALFGASLTLDAGRTLMVTGNETLGGAGPFSLSLNTDARTLSRGLPPLVPRAASRSTAARFPSAHSRTTARSISTAARCTSIKPAQMSTRRSSPPAPARSSSAPRTSRSAALAPSLVSIIRACSTSPRTPSRSSAPPRPDWEISRRSAASASAARSTPPTVLSSIPARWWPATARSTPPTRWPSRRRSTAACRAIPWPCRSRSADTSKAPARSIT